MSPTIIRRGRPPSTTTVGVRAVIGIAAVALLAAACADGGAPTEAVPPLGETVSGEPLRMARATWDTGWFQAAIHERLLDELGYDVTDPARETLAPVIFYPALARGEFDLWANGWFPLHEPFLDSELLTGQRVSEPIEPVGELVPGGAIQGYLVDRATAEELGITSTDDFLRPEVTEAFDQDGDGMAELYGCDEGWGCNVAIERHLDELAWGEAVEQVVGRYDDLLRDASERIAAGLPTLYYTWTPNWTVGVLEPGEDVLWLESSPLPDVEAATQVAGLEGCAGTDPCRLGWPVDDIRAVANSDFLAAHPPIRRLLEAVSIPLEDIAEQNARMHAADEYTEQDIRADAEDWIAQHRGEVDGWLDAARG